MKTYHKFDDKSILIWGYGREGKSTEQFLKDCACPKSVTVFEGKREEIDEDQYDYIIKSPGIVMEEDHPKYTSQTEIFMEVYRQNVIGITGTKGKSTTSAMLYHVLKECLDRPVILLGNIGEPCLNHFQEITPETVVVFELSCHQLAHASASPHVAVMLNLYEEHLDYYKTFEKYFAAKCNVTKYQTPDDYFFVGAQVPPVETAAQRVVRRWEDAPEYEMQILGIHNHYNAYFVYSIATEVYGVDGEKAKASIASFTGLNHRLQKIGTVDGVDYYDDSISTIPNATIEALKAVPNSYSVIIGGMDRGICYDTLIQFINEHSEYQYILAYETGKRIYQEITNRDSCIYVEDLKQAVEQAKAVTPKGRACILSPAAASYGYFKNFEERGDVFKEYVGV